MSEVASPNEQRKSILERWEITEAGLTQAIDENPSLRGMLFGYVAEYKLRAMWFENRRHVTHYLKHDDHNRKKKGDLVVTYKGMEFVIECKSLQTSSIRQSAAGTFIGKTQCDASDRRTVTFADGSTLNTTCLLRGEFDMLAVNLFGFEHRWRFAFAKNSALPPNTYRRYSTAQQSKLLPSLIPLTWPLQAPFSEDPYKLLDEMLAAANARRGRK
jgi:hypothetical protein